MTTPLAALAEKIIAGYQITLEEAGELLNTDYDGLLHQANRLRKHFKGNAINLCSIINAKSGRCPENCRYCSQSAHNHTNVAEYPLVDEEQIVNACTKAANSGAKCFGIITSGRAITPPETETVCRSLDKLRHLRIKLSCSIGVMDKMSLAKLKSHGMSRFHHNIETAPSFFPSICTTHTIDDKLRTIRFAKEVGLEVCSGGIIGMGESAEQRIEFAFTLRELDVDSVPVNILNPIEGTPLAQAKPLHPTEILRTIAVFRFILPNKDITVCGGRETNLRDCLSWIFYAWANGTMTGGYLTTPGREPAKDIAMINDLGLTVNE